MLRLILTCVQVFAAFVIIGLVLLQRGKGAEAGAGFGAGASGTVFGARGATTALSRATAVFAAIFMLNSLALAYLGTSASRESEAQKTILDEAALPKPKPTTATPGTTGTSGTSGTTGTSQPAAPQTSAPATPATTPAAPPPAPVPK